MSAANIILREDAAHLITDAAAFEDDGSIQVICSKVLYFTDLRVAISTRGRVWARTDLASEISHGRPASVEQLIAGLPGMLAAAYSIVKTSYDFSADDASSVVHVVGWHTPSAKPFGYICATDNNWVPKPYVPWTMQPVSRSVAPGVPGSDAIIDSGRPIDEVAVQLLEAQRRDPFRLPGRPLVRRVGGFGEVTTITADRWDVRRVIEWPEKVGEPIAA